MCSQSEHGASGCNILPFPQANEAKGLRWSENGAESLPEPSPSTPVPPEELVAGHAAVHRMKKRPAPNATAWCGDGDDEAANLDSGGPGSHKRARLPHTKVASDAAANATLDDPARSSPGTAIDTKPETKSTGAARRRSQGSTCAVVAASDKVSAASQAEDAGAPSHGGLPVGAGGVDTVGVQVGLIAGYKPPTHCAFGQWASLDSSFPEHLTCSSRLYIVLGACTPAIAAVT